MLKLLVLIPVLLLVGHRRLGFLAEAATAAAMSSVKSQDQSPILLVVSYDSFRNKYLEYGLTPSLKKVQQEGVSVPYMRNVFTTKTFPNHFSIATGLYPDKHGVVNSVIFDHKVGELKYGQEYFGMDKRVTPIWTLNEELGGHSACLYFPASNLMFHNRTCTFTETFKQGLEFHDRVNFAFEYMQHPTTPANLVMLYFEQPDEAGHKFGSDSAQVKEEVAHVDRITKSIMDAAEKSKLASRLNVIFLSDHGMLSVKLSDMIDLNMHTDNSTYTMYGSSPVVQIVPKAGHFDNVLNSLREAAKKVGHFKVYTNEELPDRWHYRNDQRVGPITIVADLGYIFNDFIPHVVNYFKQQNLVKTDDVYGVHGYDNEEESMRAIFMAKGPAFKSRFHGKAFDNVDLYYLFCKVLNLKAPKRLDGNEKNIDQFLVEPSAGGNKIRTDGDFSWLAVGLMIGLLISIGIVIITMRHMRLKWNRRKIEMSELDAAFGSETALLIASNSDGE